MLPLDFYISQFTPLPSPPKGDQLKGKIIVLTGANSGIGLEVAHHLTAMRPARLILAVRDPTTAASTEALDVVLKRSPGGVKVELWPLDLASFDSVKGFAKQCEVLGKVDVLINNAGRHPGFHPTPISKTADGHEQIHQINVLSQILLLCLLHTVLSKSAAPQVVFTSSEVHAWAATPPIAAALRERGRVLEWFDDDKAYDNTTRYFQSKLLLQMVIRSLIPAVPYHVVSVNPGLCRSNLGRDIQFPKSFSGIQMAAWFLSTARSAEVGARNVTHAVFADDSYEFWSDCKPHAAPSTFMTSKTGVEATRMYWQEVKAVLEKVSPGSTDWLGKQ